VVYSGNGSSQRTLYADGAVIGTDTSGAVGSFTGNLQTGNNGSSCCGYTTNGADYVDDVRIYNRALSGAEIQAIYNGGK